MMTYTRRITVILLSALMLLTLGCSIINSVNKNRVIKRTHILHDNGVVEVIYEEFDGDIHKEYTNY